MVLSRKTWTWIIIIAVIVLIAAIVIYLFRCNLFPGLSSCVQDPNETNTPVPPGASGTKWIPEAFPLNVGMFGSKIKALQKALGIADDGKFGNDTKNAIIAAGKSVPLSQAGYDAIIMPPTLCLNRPKAPVNQWITGRPVYALFARSVKSDTDNNSETIITLPTCGTASYQGPASKPGWSKVRVNKGGIGVDGYIATAAVTQFTDGV